MVVKELEKEIKKGVKKGVATAKKLANEKNVKKAVKVTKIAAKEGKVFLGEVAKAAVASSARVEKEMKKEFKPRCGCRCCK